MNVLRLLFVSMAALTLAACSTAHCRKPDEYASAQSVQPLPAIAGLKFPESPSALRIPPAPENPVAFGEKYKDEDGDERWSCLDVPQKLEVKADVAAPKS